LFIDHYHHSTLPMLPDECLFLEANFGEARLEDSGEARIEESGSIILNLPSPF